VRIIKVAAGGEKKTAGADQQLQLILVRVGVLVANYASFKNNSRRGGERGAKNISKHTHAQRHFIS
jgi:hypothetical protein